jgi:hypothetical protein
VEGSCEHGNEPSGSIKRWEILEWLHNWQLLKKGSAQWMSEWVLRFSGNMFTSPLPSSGHILYMFHYSGFQPSCHNSNLSFTILWCRVNCITFRGCRNVSWTWEIASVIRILLFSVALDLNVGLHGYFPWTERLCKWRADFNACGLPSNWGHSYNGYVPRNCWKLTRLVLEHNELNCT